MLNILLCLYGLTFYFIPLLLYKNNKKVGLLLAFIFILADIYFQLFNYFFIYMGFKFFASLLSYFILVYNKKRTKYEYFLGFLIGSFFCTSSILYNGVMIKNWEVYQSYQENMMENIKTPSDVYCQIYDFSCTLNKPEEKKENKYIEKIINKEITFWVVFDATEEWKLLKTHFLYLASCAHIAWMFFFWYFKKQHKHLKN